MSCTGNFTSGVTGDNKYIISMYAYLENDIRPAFERTKIFQRLSNAAYIKIDEYEECYLTVVWEGSKFYPTFHKEEVEDSELVRVYTIFNNEVNVLEH